MKILILALVLSCFIAGCATKQKSVPRTEGPEKAGTVSPIAVYKSPAPAEKVITGRKFFLDHKLGKKALSEDTLRRVLEVTRKYMKSQNFEEVPSRRKAHLTLYIATDRSQSPPREIADETPDESSYTSREIRIENGKVVSDLVSVDQKIARLSIVVHVNAYGKRPLNLSSVTFLSPHQEWTGYEDKLVEIADKELVGLIGRAPTGDSKMDGDPGCLPRFGYEQDQDKVIEVGKGSPAQEAGVQVGDVILAIDSEPMDGYDADPEIYEKKIRVPMKIQRGTQVIRTQIQAKILCD